MSCEKQFVLFRDTQANGRAQEDPRMGAMRQLAYLHAVRSLDSLECLLNLTEFGIGA